VITGLVWTGTQENMVELQDGDYKRHVYVF